MPGKSRALTTATQTAPAASQTCPPQAKLDFTMTGCPVAPIDPRNLKRRPQNPEEWVPVFGGTKSPTQYTSEQEMTTGFKLCRELSQRFSAQVVCKPKKYDAFCEYVKDAEQLLSSDHGHDKEDYFAAFCFIQMSKSLFSTGKNTVPICHWTGDSKYVFERCDPAIISFYSVDCDRTELRYMWRMMLQQHNVDSNKLHDVKSHENQPDTEDNNSTEEPDIQALVNWPSFLEKLIRRSKCCRMDKDDNDDIRRKKQKCNTIIPYMAEKRVAWMDLLGYLLADLFLTCVRAPIHEMTKRLCEIVPKLQTKWEIDNESKSDLLSGIVACMLDVLTEWLYVKDEHKCVASEISMNNGCPLLKHIVDLLLSKGLVHVLARNLDYSLAVLVSDIANILLRYNDVYHRLESVYIEDHKYTLRKNAERIKKFVVISYPRLFGMEMTLDDDTRERLLMAHLQANLVADNLSEGIKICCALEMCTHIPERTKLNYWHVIINKMQADESLDQADTLLNDLSISSVRVRALKEYAHSYFLKRTRCVAARTTHVPKPSLELEQLDQSLNAEHKTFDKSPSYSPSPPNTVNSSGGNDEVVPEELRGLDKELIEKIENEIVDSGERVTFNDIAGLSNAKSTVYEMVVWPMLRPEMFTGLRAVPNGLLLFGPPGTGKTLIGKAIAHESGATFFSISSSSLTSKWIGEGEKLVRTLFAVAKYRSPAVVFIDEVDSMLTSRKADENESSRRIKTEFLVQLDGAGNRKEGSHVIVVGATNRPQELDDAARRRFVKRLYIPLPTEKDRETLLRNLLSMNRHELTDREITKLSNATEGFSGADLKVLCTDAAMGPVRQLGQNAMSVSVDELPAISYKHFRRSLKRISPSVDQADLDVYLEWNNTYGTKSVEDGDDAESDDESIESFSKDKEFARSLNAENTTFDNAPGCPPSSPHNENMTSDGSTPSFSPVENAFETNVKSKPSSTSAAHTFTSNSEATRCSQRSRQKNGSELNRKSSHSGVDEISYKRPDRARSTFDNARGCPPSSPHNENMTSDGNTPSFSPVENAFETNVKSKPSSTSAAHTFTSNSEATRCSQRSKQKNGSELNRKSSHSGVDEISYKRHDRARTTFDNAPSCPPSSPHNENMTSDGSTPSFSPVENAFETNVKSKPSSTSAAHTFKSNSEATRCSRRIRQKNGSELNRKSSHSGGDEISYKRPDRARRSNRNYSNANQISSQSIEQTSESQNPACKSTTKDRKRNSIAKGKGKGSTRIAKGKGKGSTRKRKSWGERFESLANFKEENGHLDFLDMKEWIRCQRKMKKNGKLSDDQIEMLDSIGFIWDSHEYNWHKKYNLLSVGDDDRLTNDRDVKQWVLDQIRSFRNGSLTRERADLLRAKGIAFEDFKDT